MLKFTCSMLALAGSIAAAAPALALSPADSDDSQIIVTATGTPQPRDESGQAITVLDAQTIRQRQDVNVVDLLATTPGVRFNRTGSTGSVTGVSLRGAESDQTLVLIDGVRVNDVSSTGNGFDFGNLLVGNIDRIEILRGPNSVAYGSQAIGGVINVTTAVPTEGFATNASAEYGYSDTVNAKANVSGGSGIVSGGAGIAYFNTDGISSAARSATVTEKDGYRNITANAKLKLTFSDALSIDLRGYYIDAKLDYDSFFGAPGDSSDISKSKQYIGYAGVNAALFDGKFTSRAAVTYSTHDRDYYPARGLAPDFGYEGRNLRFEYQGVVTPVEPVKLIFGYEHERPKYDFAGFGSAETHSAHSDNVYGMAVVKPVTGLSVTGGLRYTNHSQFGGATTLGANANYSPNGGATSIRLSYGEGFKAPSLYQLYDGFSGSRTLRAERSKSYDAGIDQKLLGDKVVLSLTAFQRKTQNQIDYDPTLPPFGRYNNIDRTRTKGAEVMLALRPVEALTVTAAYSYIDARDRSAGTSFGKRLARRAPNSISVSADYDWAFGLSTGATLNMVGDSFSDTANAVRLDGYAVLGVRASFPIGERLEVYGRIDNLFDEQYRTVANYGTYGRAAYGGVRVRF